MFPEPIFPLQNAAPSSAFCAVSELGPRWGPPELALGGLLGPVHTGLLQAKSAFSAKEKTFGVGFQLWKHQPSAVPTEPEAAQPLLGPKGSRGLGEN